MSTDQDLVDGLRSIRHALLIGLASFGEVERVIDFYETLECCGKVLPAELRPLHPTGASDTVGKFADALRCIDNMEPQEDPDDTR